MPDLIVFLNLVLSTVTFALIAKWYVLPWTRRVSFETAVKPLLLLHSFRHIGMMFLSAGAVKQALPEPFALPAGCGDLLASVLAFTALFAVVFRFRHARVLVWVFNVEGTVDLLAAVTLGVVYGAVPGMGATYWIPAVIVPALLVTHGVVFVLLLRPGRSNEPSLEGGHSAPAAPA